jgi:post-segregation antitoxin (ccd killing protein)
MSRPSHRRRSTQTVTLNIQGELLRVSREQAIDLSATLESALEQSLRVARCRRWLADNAVGIEAYNAQVEKFGTFAEGLQSASVRRR